MNNPTALGDLLKLKLDESRMKELYRHNTLELERQRVHQGGSEHYTEMSVQPWEVIDSWPAEQQIGYHRGNILKYTMRMGSKDERLKEAKKIKHYAEKLVEVLERVNGADT
mgnify:CR=1 FL=1